ncbi:MAG TPA: N-acetylmuramoyl-L-alanine amidase [Candidatus Deferrimicrobiaceae bacterium]|jgi:N-acetylmuramoyl-L-alanine amidase
MFSSRQAAARFAARLLLLVLLPASAFAQGARVSGIRFWNSDQYTRVAVDLDTEAAYETRFLPASSDGRFPPRILIDIKQAVIHEDILRKPVEVRNGLLKVVRAGRFKPGVVRVVIDLEKTCSYQAFTMVDPYRIIVDVDGQGMGDSCPLPADGNSAAGASSDNVHPVLRSAPPAPLPGSVPMVQSMIPRPVPPPVPEALPAPEPRETAAEDQPTGRPEASPPGQAKVPRFRVMLDPGHGGKDSGAVGFSGLKEKDIVLELGRLVRERLQKEGGCDIRMTRDTDVFIPLEERTAMANKAHADLFVSLHINASPNRKADGISTYVLSRAGSDRAALELAARENGVPVAKLTGVKFILDDLSLFGRKKESMKLAKTVNDAIVRNLSGKYGQMHNLGLKQAPFYVLVGARMTAVLIESAFISNERDEKRLREHAYLETIADSVVEAIRYYARNGAIASRAGI